MESKKLSNFKVFTKKNKVHIKLKFSNNSNGKFFNTSRFLKTIFKDECVNIHIIIPKEGKHNIIFVSIVNFLYYRDLTEILVD